MSSDESPTLSDLVAHSAPEGSGEEQSLEDHLRGVAEKAAGFAEAFESEAFAEWLGWWHDAGKVHGDIQDYLNDRGPSKDHSSVGMLHALDVPNLALAHSIAGHHGGLLDHSALRERAGRKREETRITDALEQARGLLDAVAPDAPDAPPDYLQAPDGEEYRRRAAFWLRMLHSCLVDADCLDTERHFDPERADRRDRSEAPSLDELWRRFEADQQQLVEDARPLSEVNQRRQAVYEACLEHAADAPGFFSLTVPTGGGKTRSALAFALRHAMAHGKKRVVTALPYTSIIEQNADVYRDILEDESDARPVVLEHHSAAGSASEDSSDDDGEPDETDIERWRRLSAQNWDVPVVMTTTVQLLESLFASRNGRVRKLHRLAGSVIVLDEVQTIPPKLLRSTLEALRQLVEHFGATVVLCTATQPALAEREDFPDGLPDVREITPDAQDLYGELRRVDYQKHLDEPWPWARVAEEMQTEEQSMVVCNTTDDARAALDALPDADHVRHLSARLCGAHRRRVLAEGRDRLDDGRPLHLVATQVVEAGVDISFPLVLRAAGPLDRIIQAAGRCNREAELKGRLGRVVVFRPEDGGTPPGAYEAGRDLTVNLLRDAPDLDLHDPELPRRYFAALYDTQNLDDAGIQQARAAWQFREVGRRYCLIDDDTTPVIVDYEGEGWDLAHEVADRAEYAGFVHRDDWRRLQPYTVKLHAWAFDQALDDGNVLPLAPDAAPDLWRWDGGYDERRRGLLWDGPSASALAV